MINPGDHLKVKQAKGKPGPFWKKRIPVYFCFCSISLFAKRNRFLPPLGFSIIALQIYRVQRNFKENRKRALNLNFFFFLNLRKSFLDIRIRNVMTNFESSRYTYTPTNIHTYILPNLGNT